MEIIDVVFLQKFCQIKNDSNFILYIFLHMKSTETDQVTSLDRLRVAGFFIKIRHVDHGWVHCALEASLCIERNLQRNTAFLLISMFFQGHNGRNEPLLINLFLAMKLNRQICV